MLSFDLNLFWYVNVLVQVFRKKINIVSIVTIIMFLAIKLIVYEIDKYEGTV